jgi:hypothetical protein
MRLQMLHHVSTAESSFYSLMEFLVSSISNTAALTDRETPQYAALDWSANVDKTMIDLEMVCS